MGESLAVDELLGHGLNEVEKKYAPPVLYTAGHLDIAKKAPRISIIGSRKATPDGLENARKITAKLVQNGAVIVSGLAAGIDTMAHQTAIENGGETIAVLGTSLDKTYPTQNAALQQEIMQNHLAISQFSPGYVTQRRNFVIRNRTMALVSNASIIVEAGEDSGSRHQGWEALRLGRPLYLWVDLINNIELQWPQKMLDYGAMELSDTMTVFEQVPVGSDVPAFLLN